ncbi:MAG TPA: hypothetical protein VIY09_04200 [Rhizomicrobium sp.]
MTELTSRQILDAMHEALEAAARRVASPEKRGFGSWLVAKEWRTLSLRLGCQAEWFVTADR